MSYGTTHDDACPRCEFPVTVVSYDTDPPPIPMRLPAEVHRRDDFDPPSRYHECPRCGLDFSTLDYDPHIGCWIEAGHA